MLPQRCRHPKSQNLWLCYLTQQKGCCTSKLRNLRWEIYPGLSGEPEVATGSLQAEEGGEKLCARHAVWERLNEPLLSWKWKGVTSQEGKKPLETGKDKQNVS